ARRCRHRERLGCDPSGKLLRGGFQGSVGGGQVRTADGGAYRRIGAACIGRKGKGWTRRSPRRCRGPVEISAAAAGTSGVGAHGFRTGSDAAERWTDRGGRKIPSARSTGVVEAVLSPHQRILCREAP